MCVNVRRRKVYVWLCQWSIKNKKCFSRLDIYLFTFLILLQNELNNIIPRFSKESLSIVYVFYKYKVINVIFKRWVHQCLQLYTLFYLSSLQARKVFRLCLSLYVFVNMITLSQFITHISSQQENLSGKYEEK